MLMTDQELRRWAIEKAADHNWEGTSWEGLVSQAQNFYDFVKGSNDGKE